MNLNKMLKFNWDSDIELYFQWFVLIMCWVILAMLVFFAVIVWPLSHVKRVPSQEEKAVQACIDKGGVPLTNGNSGGYLLISDCKFK